MTQAPPPVRPIFRTVLLALMVLFSAYLLVGGIWLLALGGSAYYLLAGLVLATVVVQLRKKVASALWLYTILLVATLGWGLWEAGTDFWALAPRLGILFLLGLALLAPVMLSGMADAGAGKRALSGVLALTLVVMGVAIFNDPQEIHGDIPAIQPEAAAAVPGIDNRDWPAYGRTQAGVRYSPLKQINDTNVGELKQAWVLQTGDVRSPDDPGEVTNEVTPIKIGDNMYICSTHQMLIAIDPATGKEKWRYDPKQTTGRGYMHMTCRGVSYHDAGNTAGFAASLKQAHTTSAQCPRKVLLPVNDGRLIAINADNGALCSDFGENGVVNLLKSMPFTENRLYKPTSPPVVTGTTIIIGGLVTDNYSTQQPGGAIRGYDVHTGKLRWVFDTGAKDPNMMPGEKGEFVNNAPNAWAPLAYDAVSDTVYVPTGVGTPDIWGGDRTELKERYANAMLALNASTGKLRWHFQTTHHDLWDMDVPAQPSLVDLQSQDGKVVPAIYVLTKTGNVFVLNRHTGEAIVPVEEKPVPVTVSRGPQTSGERYSPTQPFSALNLAPQDKLTDKDMWGATMFDQLMCRIIFKRLNYDGIYTPPSENGTLVFPGNLGVFEWGGMSVNPDRQLAVMNPIGLPFVSRLIPMDPNREKKTGEAANEHGLQPMYGTPYAVNMAPFLSPLGLPCKQPAWGYVAGVDLSTHQVVWKKRIGTIRDSLPALFQLPPVKIGVPGLGGPMSTAGNVMFVAGTQDNYLRAYNVTNGKLLWEGRLPAGGQATPMTYEANGRQYVVVMAGGHGSFGTKMGDYLVAFALPDVE